MGHRHRGRPLRRRPRGDPERGRARRRRRRATDPRPVRGRLDQARAQRRDRDQQEGRAGDGRRPLRGPRAGGRMPERRGESTRPRSRSCCAERESTTVVSFDGWQAIDAPRGAAASRRAGRGSSSAGSTRWSSRPAPATPSAPSRRLSELFGSGPCARRVGALVLAAATAISCRLAVLGAQLVDALTAEEDRHWAQDHRRPRHLRAIPLRIFLPVPQPVIRSGPLPPVSLSLPNVESRSQRLQVGTARWGAALPESRDRRRLRSASGPTGHRPKVTSARAPGAGVPVERRRRPRSSRSPWRRQGPRRRPHGTRPACRE